MADSEKKKSSLIFDCDEDCVVLLEAENRKKLHAALDAYSMESEHLIRFLDSVSIHQWRLLNEKEREFAQVPWNTRQRILNLTHGIDESPKNLEDIAEETGIDKDVVLAIVMDNTAPDGIDYGRLDSTAKIHGQRRLFAEGVAREVLRNDC